jgi:hypothetical protein
MAHYHIKVKFSHEKIYDSIEELPGGLDAVKGNQAIHEAFVKEENTCKEKKGTWVIEINKLGIVIRSFDWSAVVPQTLESPDIFRMYRSYTHAQFQDYVKQLKSHVEQGEKYKVFHFMEGTIDLPKDKNGYYKLETVSTLSAYFDHFFPKRTESL